MMEVPSVLLSLLVLSAVFLPLHIARAQRHNGAPVRDLDAKPVGVPATEASSTAPTTGNGPTQTDEAVGDSWNVTTNEPKDVSNSTNTTRTVSVYLTLFYPIDVENVVTQSVLDSLFEAMANDDRLIQKRFVMTATPRSGCFSKQRQPDDSGPGSSIVVVHLYHNGLVLTEIRDIRSVIEDCVKTHLLTGDKNKESSIDVDVLVYTLETS